MGDPEGAGDLCVTEAGGVTEGYFRGLLGERASTAAGGETDYPPLDIYETAGHFSVEVEIPGVDIADLEVSVASGMLFVEGVKEEVFEHGRVNFLCMERTFGFFRRVVPLPHPIDPTRIKAVYRLGILAISIPKVEEKRGQRLTIRITKG